MRSQVVRERADRQGPLLLHHLVNARLDLFVEGLEHDGLLALALDLTEPVLQRDQALSLVLRVDVVAQRLHALTHLLLFKLLRVTGQSCGRGMPVGSRLLPHLESGPAQQ